MLFKILHGDPSKISFEETAFHEGYCYVTYDGFFYFDLNTGTAAEPNNQRLKVKAGEAEKLTGYTVSQILSASAVEIPTSSAVFSMIKQSD